MMAKKVAAVVPCVLLALSLGAMVSCQKAQPQMPMTGPSGVSEAIKESSSSEIEEEAGEDAEFSTPQKEMIDASAIEEVSDFSDGCAWVETADDRILVNSEGEILLQQGDTEYGSISEYSNGAALAYDNHGDFVAMIDKEGNPLWTLETDGWNKAYELYGSEDVTNVTVGGFDYGKWSGYLRVNFIIDTFDFTGGLTGAIDVAGNWVVEPLSIDEAKNWDMDSDPAGSRYWLPLSERGVFLYRTGELLERTPEADTLMSGHTYGGFSTTKLQDREEYFACGNMLYTGHGQFENVEGEVVLDISSMPLAKYLTDPDGMISWDAFAYGDYCLVMLSNEQAATYLTVIDKSGTQMFDPIRSGEHSELTSVAFFYKPDPTGKNPVEEAGYYIDVNGNMLGDVRGEEGTPFYENRAWLKVDDEWRCIDETGAIVI